MGVLQRTHKNRLSLSANSKEVTDAFHSIPVKRMLLGLFSKRQSSVNRFYSSFLAPLKRSSHQAGNTQSVEDVSLVFVPWASLTDGEAAPTATGPEV